MENETITISGSVHVTLTGPDGQLKQEHTDHNLIVTIGKSYLTAWLAAASQAGSFMSYMGLGTGTTAAASGDTALQAEFSGGGYSRQVGTLSNLTNVWTNTAIFSPGVATGAITEAGLFTTLTAGTMFARQVFPAYNKQAADTLTFAWSVTFS